MTRRGKTVATASEWKAAVLACRRLGHGSVWSGVRPVPAMGTSSDCSDDGTTDGEVGVEEGGGFHNNDLENTSKSTTTSERENIYYNLNLLVDWVLQRVSRPQS